LKELSKEGAQKGEATENNVDEEKAFLAGLKNKLPGTTGIMGEPCKQTVQGVGPNQQLINPLAVFVSQERILLQQLWAVVDSELQKLQDAILGLQILDEALEMSLEAVRFNRVPPSWLKAFPSLKNLASWMEDFNKRWHHIEGWLLRGPCSIYWISGMVFPQGFLTSLLQTHARNSGTPVDQLEFGVSVLNKRPSSPATIGAHIDGPFLQVRAHGIFFFQIKTFFNEFFSLFILDSPLSSRPHRLQHGPMNTKLCKMHFQGNFFF